MNAIPKGLRAKVKHERKVQIRPGVITFATEYVAHENGWELLPHGGVTTCRIVNENDEVVAEAEAVCNPREGFNKRLGYTIALGRAAKALRTADSGSEGVLR